MREFVIRLCVLAVVIEEEKIKIKIWVSIKIVPSVCLSVFCIPIAILSILVVLVNHDFYFKKSGPWGPIGCFNHIYRCELVYQCLSGNNILCNKVLMSGSSVCVLVWVLPGSSKMIVISATTHVC